MVAIVEYPNHNTRLGDGIQILKTPEKRVEVQIDEDVILKTHISGLEPDSVTWVKHQSQLEINDKYSYGRKGPDYSLQINSVRWYDSGVYKCLVNGKEICRTEVNVKASAQMETSMGAPTFLSRPEPHNVPEGDTIVLSCTADGMPMPSMRWLKDGQQINSDGRFELSPAKGPTHWITVKNVRPEDSGKYSCIAENSKGTAWCAVNVQVSPEGTEVPQQYQSAPMFTSKPKSCRVASTTDCLLRCAVRGVPQPRVTWYKNGASIEGHSGKYLADSKGHGIHTLKILDVDRQDAGAYSVIAESAAGEASCSCTVEVYNLEPVSENFKPVVSFGNPNEPQKIAKKSVCVTAGKTARLTLEVNGSPLPEVTWYKDGKKIYQGKRFAIIEQGNNFSLKILRICKEDEGIYECCAINKAGIGRAVVDLTVKEQEVFRPVKSSRLVVVDEGKDAFLAVDVVDAKFQVIWSKDGEDIEQDDKFKLMCAGNKRILKIVKAQKSDQGHWRVRAAGREVIVELRVNAINQILVAPVTSKWVCAGDDLVLDAELAPSADKISWFLNDKPLSANPRVDVAPTSENGLRLTIKEMRGEDGGVLKLQAGSGSSETHVTVVEAPVGLRLRKEKEKELEARWNLLPESRSLGFYEVQLGSTTGKSSIKVDWDSNRLVKTDGNRNMFKDLSPGYYTFRVRAITPAPVSDRPEKGPWAILPEPVLLEAGAVLTRGLVDTSVMEGETCRLSIECGGTVRGASWYLNGAKVSNDFVSIEGETHQLVLRDLKEPGLAHVAWKCGDLETECMLNVTGKPPRLVRGLQSQQVLPGTDVVFSVRLSKPGTLKPEWSINSLPIPESNTRIIPEQRDELYILTIKKCTRAENGEIEFELPLEEGNSIFSKATLEVEKPKPAIDQPLASKTVVDEDEDAKFYFYCDPSKIHLVKWYHNDKLVQNSKKYKIEAIESTGEAVLTLIGCSMADAGKVEARLDAEITSSDFTVNQGPAKFTCSNIQKMSTQCGQSVDLKVTVSRSDAVVKWTRDGEELNDPRISTSENGCDRILKITQVRHPGDSGVYKCEVVDDRRQDEVTIDLEVQKAFETFLTPLQANYECVEGDVLVMECEVSAEDAMVQWMKDGVMISKAAKLSTESVGLFRRLKIKDADQLDAAQYSCETLHDKTQTRVAVNEPVITVLEKMENQTCVEGGTVSFELLLSHSFRSKVPITWMINAKPLIDNRETVQISALANGHYAVTLRRCQRTMNGSTITFAGGKISATAKLEVTLPPFRFIKDPSSVDCYIGECIVLFCEISHAEHKVIWLKNGEEISEKSKHFTIFVDGCIRKLRIANSKEDDTAEYTVAWAENHKEKRTAKVGVTKPPIEVLHPVQDLEIEEGDVAEFVIEVSRPLKIAFFLDDEELFHSPGEIEIESEADSTIHRIFIFNTTEADSGCIKAKAVTYGEFISEAVLDVVRPPIHFTSPLRDAVVEMKNKLTLTCEISEDAPVQWLFNDHPLSEVPDIHALATDTIRQLVIHSAAMQHEGYYTCVTPDMRRTTCEVYVQKPEVKFIEQLEDIECFVGDSISAKIRLSVADAGGIWEWDHQHLEAVPGEVELFREHEEHRITVANIKETGVLGFVVSKNCSSICKVTAKERPIKFKRRLDDLEAIEDDPFTLECELTMDKLEGEWTFEDEPIRLGEMFKYEIEGGVHRLIVAKAQYDTAGKYGFRCGKKFTFSAVSMKELEVDILSGPTDLQIKEGKQFCLSVVVSNPKAHIQWRKDGYPILGGEHFQFIRVAAGEPGGPPEGVRYVLQVEQAKNSDQGMYSFDAHNGRATCTAKVHVKREPAVVTAPLEALKVLDSVDSVDFEVKFSRADVKATWSRDNRILRGNRFVATRVDDLTWHLTVKNPTEEDSGLYCVECEDCASHAMLRVIPWKTEIVEPLQSLTAELNSKAEFKTAVSLDNIKPEEVTWFWNDEPVSSDDDRFAFNIEDDYIHSFTVLRVEEEMLHSVVKFQARDASTEAKLLVYVPPAPPKHLRVVKNKHDWAILQWDAPENPGTLPIIGYELECRVEEEKWAPIGPDLITTNSTKIEDLEGGVEHRFRVKAVTAHGSAAASITTDPLIPWVPLKVSKHLPSAISCYEGDRPKLECKFTLTEEQEQCEWYHESDLIEFGPSNKEYLNLSDGVRRKLEITSARLDQSGLYMCKVGDFTTECILEVSKRPADFSVKFESQKGKLGENIKFTCNVEKPDVNVIWMKNGVELPDSERYKISWDDCVHTLEIENAVQDDKGEYSALIMNTENICSANLDIEVPEISLELDENTLAKPGGHHTFSVMLEEENVHVTWSKDGKILENGEKYKIRTDKRWYHMEIYDIDKFDEGSYQCQIEGSDVITTAFLQVDDVKHLPSFDADAYIANVLADSDEDSAEDEYSAGRHHRASMELASVEVAPAKKPEFHTYQEIVEIIEIEERVPASHTHTESEDLLSDATDSDIDGSILSDEESEVDIGEFTSPGFKPLPDLPTHLRDQIASPTPSRATSMRGAPTPGLARIITEAGDGKTDSPSLDLVRKRKPEDIVKEIESIARSPLPTLSPLPARVHLDVPDSDDDILSDGDETESDEESVLSDASSDEETENKNEGVWASVNVGDEKLKSEVKIDVAEAENVIETVEIDVHTTKSFTSNFELVKTEVEQGNYEEVVVNVDEGINISVEFTGKPAPKATWVREGGLPVEAVVKTTEESTSLIIDNAKAEHAGTYGLVLENDYGAQAAAFKVVMELEPNKEEYLDAQAVLAQAEHAYHLQFKDEAETSEKAKQSLEAEYGESLTIEHEIQGRAEYVEWDLEGSAEYFEGEMTYKNGVTTAQLFIDSVTDATSGTYVCTAAAGGTKISKKTVVLVREETSFSESDVIIKEGLKVDGSKASYEEVYEEGSFRRKSEKAQKLRKTTKIETKRNDQPELFEIVVDHAEENIQWKKGQIVTVKEKHSGDWWEVQVETRDGSKHTGGIKPWRLSEFQPTSRDDNPTTIYRQLAWQESELKKSMNRLTLNDPELKVLLDQVMNSRTALYGALQDSIVDADLLLSAMEPLEFAAHSHLIAQIELKQSMLSKSELFELRKIKGHLMGWLVHLKALLRRASAAEASILIDALDATALMLHRADLLLMWGHIENSPMDANVWGCPERQGKLTKLSASRIAADIYSSDNSSDNARYLFLFPGRLAICRRDPDKSGYLFVKAVHFQNTQISRGFGGNPAAFEILTHDHGKLERMAFECSSIGQCDIWCKDIEAELRRAMLSQFTRPARSTGAPQITKELETAMVRIGEPFELKCTISGQPTPHVIWMKDRKNIQSSDDLILASKSGVYSLFVRAAKKADQGTYRVIAKSASGEVMSQCTVTVIERAIIEVLRDTAESLKRKESYQSICSESSIDTTKTIHSDSPDALPKNSKKPARPRSLGKLKIIQSLDSICEMCDDLINRKEQMSLEKARSIEDLTASLERFGTLEEEEVNADLFAELDEVIGGFMQLSKQHFVVQSTLTIDKHSVGTTNIEELANHMDPQLAPRIIIPPTNVDFFEGKPFQLRAVVAGIPKPQIRWYKSKMILDSNTRMVDVLGKYILTADNIHGSAEACAMVKYGAMRPVSINISNSTSSIDETSVYTARSDSEYTCVPRDSENETEIETVIDYKKDASNQHLKSDDFNSTKSSEDGDAVLYIPSSDSE